MKKKKKIISEFDLAKEKFQSLLAAYNESEDAFFDELYENAIDSVEVGFDTEAAAFKKECYPATATLTKFCDKYIVWYEHEMVDGWSDGFVYMISDNEEEAKRCLSELDHSGISSGKEIIDLYQSWFPDRNLEFVCSLSGWPGCVAFNVKCEGDLIAENMPIMVSKETIASLLNKYDSATKDFLENNLKLLEIRKIPIEWNNNQRYYEYTFRNVVTDEAFAVVSHIPSKTQHKFRVTTDYCTVEQALGRTH